MNRVFHPSPGSAGGMLVLSGLDGTGKSTQAELLSRRLAGEGIRVQIIWNRWKPLLTAPLIGIARKRLGGSKKARLEDYDSFTSAKRERMRSPIKRSLWQMMVWVEYSLEVNLRLLCHGHPFRKVICDRYVYDTLVDIAVNFSMSRGELSSLCDHFLLRMFPRPARVIFIDIDPVLGSSRKDDGTPSKYLADRRDLYLGIADIVGAPVVDGGRSIDEVHEELWDLTSGWRKNF